MIDKSQTTNQSLLETAMGWVRHAAAPDVDHGIDARQTTGMDILRHKQWTANDVIRLLGCTDADLEPVERAMTGTGAVIVDSNMAFFGFIERAHLHNVPAARPDDELVPSGPGAIIMERGEFQRFVPAHRLSGTNGS